MSSFNLCSDEDMVAVFYHLDFPNKCRLRRCSRRWNYHLRSAKALHTVVFTLASEHYLVSPEKVTEALQSSFAHVANLAFIKIDQTINSSIFSSVLDIICGLASQQHHERRLHLCNLSLRLISYFNSVNTVYRLPAYDWIELRDVTISGNVACNILLFAMANRRDYPSIWLPMEQNGKIGREGLTTTITGSYIWKSRHDVSGLDACFNEHIMTKDSGTSWFELIRDNTQHLKQQETGDMLERLRQFGEDRIQAVFIWLLQEYEPDMALSSVPSVWTFDYSLCSPLVGRVLNCYNGMGDNASAGDVNSGFVPNPRSTGIPWNGTWNLEE